MAGPSDRSGNGSGYGSKYGVFGAAGAGAGAVNQHASSTLEQVLEYRFLAGVCAELLKRGADFEVLRSDVDKCGYDLAMEAYGIVRHIQLKGMIRGGKRPDVSVNSKLAPKPSGCVIWMTYDPASYELESFRWFGAGPGHRLPELGDVIAQHSKGTSGGVKLPRPKHRILRRRQFELIVGFPAIVDQLFGLPPSRERSILIDHIRAGPQLDSHLPIWVGKVREGRFECIPSSLTFDDSVYLAHLINGYDLAAELGIEDPLAFAETQLATAMETGRWEGDCATLWVSLFLEHRRWRQASPHEPYIEMRVVLDQLARQLAGSLHTTIDVQVE